MSLTKKAIDLINEDPSLKNLLAYNFKKSEATIRRWIEKNHDSLSTPESIKIISKITGLKRSEIILNKNITKL